MKPRVLIVDDLVPFLVLLQQALGQAGMDCTTAASVAQACAVLQSQPFDLMLLEWCLDQPATEVMRISRELYPIMPVIVMSGVSLEGLDVKGDALLTGADSSLQKGFQRTVARKPYPATPKAQRTHTEGIPAGARGGYSALGGTQTGIYSARCGPP